PRARAAYPGAAGLGPWPARPWRLVPVMQPGPRGGDPVIGDARRSHRCADPAGETHSHCPPLGPRRLSPPLPQGSRPHEPAQAVPSPPTSRLVYRMLKYGTEYVQQSMQEYQRKVRGQMERVLQRKAAALGYQLIPNQDLPAEPVPAPT